MAAILLGVANRVPAEMALVPLSPYPFFLATAHHAPGQSLSLFEIPPIPAAHVFVVLSCGEKVGTEMHTDVAARC